MNAAQIVLPVTPIVHALPETRTIPNNTKCPLLIFPGALLLPATDPATAIERLLTGNGWGGVWRNGIHTVHHYHSTAHEVLAVYRGSASIQFGGEPGVALKIGAGDVVVVPAGVGHKNLGATADFAVVGAYPGRQTPDMCFGQLDERGRALRNLAKVALPERDPLYGAGGPLFDHWKA